MTKWKKMKWQRHPFRVRLGGCYQIVMFTMTLQLDFVVPLWYVFPMKKTWFIEAYINNGAVYCRNCVAETLNDDTFIDPLTLDEHESFSPIFADQIREFTDGLGCEYCFVEIYNGE